MDDVETEDLKTSLPTDVITEILIRLPVRSILRFKSVCKSWYALFSDPKFVERHLKASTENKDYANHRLITSSYFSMHVKSCPIPSVLNEEYSNSHLQYPWRSRDAHVWLIGSVNGLVFIIVDDSGLFLWNPATKESERLPQHGFEEDLHHDQLIAYGFGYDESSSDYKVVAIKTDLFINSPFQSEVKIYGLKSNSWEKIANFRKWDILGYSGKFVSGALHWLAYVGTGLNIDVGILAFNISEKTFSEVSLPYSGERFLDLIGVLDCCLCALCNFDGTEVDVWVMKEYGKMESWSKMFSITFHHNPRDVHHNAPVFISRKNEVLLMMGVKLVLYNAENDTVSVICDFCRTPKVDSSANDFRGNPEVDTYIETLVSPYHNRIRGNRSKAKEKDPQATAGWNQRAVSPASHGSLKHLAVPTNNLVLRIPTHLQEAARSEHDRMAGE